MGIRSAAESVMLRSLEKRCNELTAENKALRKELATAREEEQAAAKKLESRSMQQVSALYAELKELRGAKALAEQRVKELEYKLARKIDDAGLLGLNERILSDAAEAGAWRARAMKFVDLLPEICKRLPDGAAVRGLVEDAVEQAARADSARALVEEARQWVG